MAYDPALLSQVLGLGGIDQRQTALQRQMQTAQALRQGSGRRATTPLGAILSGVADAGGAIGGSIMEERAAKQTEALGKQRETGRQAFLSGVEQADQTGRQQEAGALLSSRPFVPFADDYNSQSLAQRDTAAQAGAQQRQQDARSLAVLSGDPVLKQWASMQTPAGGGDTLDLQRMRLEQGERRLTQAAEAEKRRAEAGTKAQAFREQQAKDAKAAAERSAIEKKAAAALNLEEGLRKEVIGSPVYKSYVEASVGLDKVSRAANDNSPAGDIALVFGLMKTLDPGSTVREGEQAQASQATNIPGQVLNLYNRVVAGTRLTPEQRADFTRTARNQFGAYETALNRHLEFYKGVGSRGGVNLSNIIPDTARAPTLPAGAQPAAQAAPAASMSPEDAAALDWARSNPADPRSAQILQRLGVR